MKTKLILLVTLITISLYNLTSCGPISRDKRNVPVDSIGRDSGLVVIIMDSTGTRIDTIKR